MIRICILWCLLVSTIDTAAQQPVFTNFQVPVRQSGETLSYPFTGGLNAPQFSVADLNHDSINDVIVFDRIGNGFQTYLGSTVPGDSGLIYASAYEYYLPRIKYWAVFRDYNNDGAMDIFAAGEGNPGEFVQVYEGFYQNDTLKFHQQLFEYPGCNNCDTRFLYYQDPSSANWFIMNINFIGIPAVDDLDSDGDLDILAFEPDSGEHLWYFENQAADNNLTDTLLWRLKNTCWGGFADPLLSSCTKLLSVDPDSCAEAIMRPAPGTPGYKLHPGASLLGTDMDLDGDKDLLVGGLGLNCITLLQNGGSSAHPWINSQDTLFPANDVSVDLFNFPAAFSLDVDRDGQSDLLFASSSSVIMEDINNVWAYRRNGSQMEWLQNDFMVGEMIDVGTGAHPVLADQNHDGLTDLIVGNFGYLKNMNPKYSSISLYRNTGSPTAPAFELIDKDWLSFSQFSPDNFDFAPALADLDYDNDLDIVVGSATGILYFVENITVPGNLPQYAPPVTNWNGIDPGSFSTPAVIDLDKDGLPDLLIGERSGNINFYRNKGTLYQPVFDTQPDLENWGGIIIPASGIGQSAPACFSLADSSITMVSGSLNGKLYAFREVNASGDTFQESSGWDILIQGRRSAPAFADIDADNLLEMAVGLQSGGIRLFKTGIAIAGVSQINSPVSRPEPKLKISPNPAGKKTSFTTNSAADWRIVDAYGHIRAEGQKNAGQYDLELSNWPAGVYWLTCMPFSQGDTANAVFIVAPR